MSEVLKVLVNVSADTCVSLLVRRVSVTLHVYLFWCMVHVAGAGAVSGNKSETVRKLQCPCYYHIHMYPFWCMVFQHMHMYIFLVFQSHYMCLVHAAGAGAVRALVWEGK